MADFPPEVRTELDNIRTTLQNLDLAVRRPERGIVESAAIGTFLHNFYSGMEHVVKQTFKLHSIPLPDSETWHKDLLELSLRENVLSEATVENLYEFLGFRHFFVHGYAVMLQESKLTSLANKASDVWESFLSDIQQYYGH